jgi:hypothetical protein
VVGDKSAAPYVGGGTLGTTTSVCVWSIGSWGKYLATKVDGPIVSGLKPGSRLSRRALFLRRLIMLKARPRERRANTPTLPPTAPPNVAMLCFLDEEKIGGKSAEGFDVGPTTLQKRRLVFVPSA